VSERLKDPYEVVVDQYRQVIKETHPDKLLIWPIISGYNVRIAGSQGWIFYIYEHTGNLVSRTAEGIGELPITSMGISEIKTTNRSEVRRTIMRYLRLKPEDGLVMIGPDQMLTSEEFQFLLQRHELAMGLSPMKVFLSHKGADKAFVRDYKETLSCLGFDPWIDEDALNAGDELERGILQGFKDSCAAVFFITPHFIDENYLATEVDYAIAEKRAKGNKFSIITLLFSRDGKKGKVPELLRRYVWKEPQSDLQALREILLALPVSVDDVYWKMF
jgi:hypothetical protein